MSACVYVLNHNGHPLMPCKPSKARLEGFRKGDVVQVKGRYRKQINSIYSNGYLAFPRVKGEPFVARPKDCELLERGTTILWQKVAGLSSMVKDSF